MYRELIEHKITNRGTVVPAGEIMPSPSAHLRYCSLFMFGQDIITYIKTNQSVSGYKGKVYCEAIWIDLDNEKDVNATRLETIELIKRLNREYGISPDDVYIYFSGKKGFHIAIHNSFVGFSHTTPVDPAKVKDFVRRLTVGLKNVDLIIYEPVRIFRIENSLHEKSGMYKIRLSFDELQCEMEDIYTLAKSPRKFQSKVNQSNFRMIEGLNNLWNNSGSYVAEQRNSEHKGNIFQPPAQGERNKTLLVQACLLFRKSELSSNAILDIISNAAALSNQGASDIIDQNELKTIVRNAERLVGEERKKDPVEELQMRSFGEWIPEWENYILQEKTNMSLNFFDINQVMQGRLKGKLGVLLGYGGAKKSLYALNIALRNMSLSDEICLYSTMEMSVPQLINRIIDHEVKDPKGFNASDTAAKIYREDINEGRNFIAKQLAAALGNRLQIIANSRMTYEWYKKAIQKVKETVGTPSILIVDGLSMMGGKGSETEVYSQNSADLKQLANEENILVILICHVSKGAERHTRDLSRNIRGSEKILDNCDFYATLSQIQDETTPEIYRQDLGFISFVDKRGTGKTVDVVYGFDARRLKMEESMLDPKQYYEAVTKKKSEELFS
jgi:hypothetical protein